MTAMIFGAGFQIFAMFLVGAGLMRLGLFEARRRAWHWGLLTVGALVGVPLSVVATRLTLSGDGGLVQGQSLNLLSGPLVSLGYLAAIVLLVAWTDARPGGALRRPIEGLAFGGRMALTHYLSQSLIASAIMYGWGLGLYGQTTTTQRIAIVFVVFLVQILISGPWLRRFRFGPAEWLWRWATYLERPAFRRSSDRPVA